MPKQWAISAPASSILIIFYFIERRAAEPILPLDLFHIGLYKSAAVIATVSAMGVFGAISYMPLFLQGVIGMAASRAGLVIMILSMGWTVGSLLAGRWINRFGYRFAAVAGMTFLVAGYAILVAPWFSSSLVAIGLSAGAVGVGMGLANLTTLVAAQTSVAPQRIGVATSTVMLFRTFGAAFAVSVMGTVMLSQMQGSLGQLRAANPSVDASIWSKLANPQNLLEPLTRAQVPADLLPQVNRQPQRRALVCVFDRLRADATRSCSKFFHGQLHTGEYTAGRGTSRV